jgi:hypothetical protein
VGVSVAAGGWDNVRDVVMELYENHLNSIYNKI